MDNQANSSLKSLVKKATPSFLLRWFHKAGLYTGYTPRLGAIQTGDLNRKTPFSREFGYDRGGPVDRYYIENFLKNESGSIRGRVLEIGDNSYTLAFGGAKVAKSDILHIHSGNPKATFVGDLSNAPHIPDNTFDCIILTQTLHLIYDVRGALKTCERILKPGGVLLLTVPGISQIDHDEWNDIWLWSFTTASMKKLMAEVFPANPASINTYGNVFIATAFLYGMGVGEVTKDQLDFTDPHYQVIITVKAVKQ